jgi:hypothetical protein
MTARKDKVGIGMSGTSIYADSIPRICSCKNYYYQQEPRLLVTDLSDWCSDPLDFVITSDVFEHLLYMVDVAFMNLRRLLKSSGVVVFSAPYNVYGATLGHFTDFN